MSFSNKKLILKLLQLVNKNGNIQNIISKDLDYATVFSYLSVLKRNGLITDLYGDLEVTELGFKKIEELNKEFGNEKIHKWISPQDEYIIEKWDKYRIYLP